MLMESAETAGFFETKNGAKSHLIMPLTQPVPGAASAASPADEKKEGFGGGGGGEDGGDGGDGISRARQPMVGFVDAKAQYLSTLIKLFEQKAEKGDIDEKLMERIERLIGTT
jgi:hypothetical protein